ncbi:MAG: LLM class flavin-dependent oxidoreductase, partial [Ktedonobacterales bacterium]
GFFVWDTLFAEGRQDLPVVDPWIALAAIAMKTQHIRIGAMLTPLTRRRPWQVARQAAALDHLSGGRLIFGAGLGYQALDFVPFGEEYDPIIRAERLDEGLAVLAGLWTGQRFSFQGSHYHIEDVTLLPAPLQSPRIPIWTAGGWPRRKPLRRAAQWDGIYLMTVNQATGNLLSPDEVREVAAYIHDLLPAENTPFDIAVNGETPSDSDTGAALVHPYREAGATWWIEYEASRTSLAAYRQRIRSGPPGA